MPDDYPEVKEDVDPNTVSLTRAELGQRSCTMESTPALVFAALPSSAPRRSS